MKYRTVVLGAGPRGRAHIEAFLTNAGRFELTAVCDRDADRMAASLADLGIARPVYTDAAAMLDRERPEVFCFATQPEDRLELVRLGIAAGVRAIAYEKPMALTLAEARAISDACEAAGVRQIVCHQHKYGAHWRRVKAMVDAGEVGRIRMIHATSKGWFFYYITHLVDYVMWLLDYPEVRWIAGHMHGRGKLDDTHPSPDYLMAQVGFADGVPALFECGPLAPCRGVPDNFWYNAGVTVHGSEGFAEVIVGRGWRAMTSAGVAGDPHIQLDEVAETAAYLADLARWLDGEIAEHPCDGRLAYRGFQVAMGMLLSSLDHRKVTLPFEESRPLIERMLQELPEDDPEDGRQA